MKALKIGLLVLLLAVVAVFVGQIVASESGEVVVLTSQGEAGPQETRLWVVEHEGVQLLRAQKDSSWYQRLVAEPELMLERQGHVSGYRAETLALGEEINQLMREKYGWRDVYIEWVIGGREESVAVALIPLTG